MITIADNITGIMDGIIIYVYYQSLFVNRKTISRIWQFLITILSCLVFGFVTGVWAGDVSTQVTIIRTGLSMAMGFLLTFFYDTVFLNRFLAVVSYQAIYSIAENGAAYVLGRVTGMQEVMDHLPEWSFVAISYMVDLVLLLLVLVFRALWERRKGVRSVMYSVLLIVIPILSSVLITIPQCASMIVTNPQFYLLLLCFLFLINIVNYVLLGNVLKAEELEQKTQALDEQLIQQKQRYNQLGEAYRDIRSFMHDTKQHFSCIRNCVKRKEYDVITAYTQEAMADLESRYAPVNTGCLAIDVLVSNYMLQTRTKGIQLTTSLKVEAQCVPVSDYHLAIILGNLLDNALNACEGQLNPKILLKIQQVENNAFAIYIANTYVPGPEDQVVKNIDEVDFIHGYGLDNVKKSVRENGGMMKVQHEKDVYSVAIVFPFDALHYIRPL